MLLYTDKLVSCFEGFLFAGVGPSLLPFDCFLKDLYGTAGGLEVFLELDTV